MVVWEGNRYWKLDNGVWRVHTSMSAENGWNADAPRKKNSKGEIIQYSTEDWFKNGKNAGGQLWNPEPDSGPKNKAKAWTKGIVGVLTGDETIMNAAIHGSTKDFLKSTGEMSDGEMAMNLTIIGAGIVGGAWANRAGAASARGGVYKPSNYKISKNQLKTEARKQGRSIDKVSDAELTRFVEEYNKRDPVDNVKSADTYWEGVKNKLQQDYDTNIINKPKWRGGSWDRASQTAKQTYTVAYRTWVATKENLQLKIDEAGTKFSKVRSLYNSMKAARDKATKEKAEAAADKAVQKFERDNGLKPLTFMEYLVEFKHVYKKNPTEAELKSFKPKFNNFRRDFKNVDSGVREQAEANYKAAGEDAEGNGTYFRMWEDNLSKHRGKVDLKSFEDEILKDSIDARDVARRTRIRKFENEHGLKNMSIEDYTAEYRKQYHTKPTREQLKQFVSDYNDFRIDLNSISENTKAKIMEDYEKGGELNPDFFEVWRINKIKKGSAADFEQALLEDAKSSRRAAETDIGEGKTGEGEGKTGDGEGKTGEGDEQGVDLGENPALDEAQPTPEEIAAFNKRFDFDADGILNAEETVIRDAVIEEDPRYSGMDAEERRLMADEEVEVDLWGEREGERMPTEEAKSRARAKAAAAAATGTGAIAGGVAAGVAAGGATAASGASVEVADGEGDGDAGGGGPGRRLMVKSIFDRLVDYFGNPYYYPSERDGLEDLFMSYFNPATKTYEHKGPLFVEAGNPFDADKPVPYTTSKDIAYHPDIIQTKAIELCMDCYFSYNDNVDHDTYFISTGDGLMDAQVKIFTKSTYKVVAFRGTDSLTDVITDARTYTSRLSAYFTFVQPNDDLSVHSGFLASVERVYRQIKEQLEGVQNFEISGHSYGAGMASIFLYVYYLDTGKQPLHAFGFGSPRVFAGNVDRYNELVDFVRFQNNNDVITYLPSKTASLNTAAGAGLGSIIGARFKNPLLGAAVGGMAARSQTDNYKHVGLGIMMFYEKNRVIQLDYLQGPRVVPETYIIIPEGEDTLRNPIDPQGVVVSAVVGHYANNAILGAIKNLQMNPQQRAFEETLMKSYDTFGGSFTKFMDSHQVLLQNKLSDAMIARLRRVRKEERDAAGVISDDTAFAGLTGRNLDNFNNALENLVDTSTGGTMDLNILGEPEFNGFMDQFLVMLGEYARKQHSDDFFAARDAMMRFNVFGVSNAVASMGAGLTMLGRVQGHRLSNYIRTLSLLPPVIYNGQNVPKTVRGQDAQMYVRKSNSPDHRHYTDIAGNTHHLDNFNNLVPSRKVLGYYFYKDPSVLNKLVIF